MSGKFNRMGLLYPFSVFISAKICGGSCGENTVLVGKIVGSFLIVVFTIDFLHSLYVEKKEDIPERVWRIKDTLIEKISRS